MINWSQYGREAFEKDLESFRNGWMVVHDQDPEHDHLHWERVFRTVQREEWRESLRRARAKDERAFLIRLSLEGILTRLDNHYMEAVTEQHRMAPGPTRKPWAPLCAWPTMRWRTEDYCAPADACWALLPTLLVNSGVLSPEATHRLVTDSSFSEIPAEVPRVVEESVTGAVTGLGRMLRGEA